MNPDWQRKDPRPEGVLGSEILVVTMRILSLVSEGKGPAKRITSLLSAVY